MERHFFPNSTCLSFPQTSLSILIFFFISNDKTHNHYDDFINILMINHLKFKIISCQTIHMMESYFFPHMFESNLKLNRLELNYIKFWIKDMFVDNIKDRYFLTMTATEVMFLIIRIFTKKFIWIDFFIPTIKYDFLKF